MIYQWREGARVANLDAQVIGERLSQIEIRHGELTPEAVVRDAKSKRSPLHSYFEWDDVTAAVEFRKQQARHLIGCIVVAPENEKRESQVRAFVSVSRGGKKSYANVATALSDAELREQVLENARREILAWGERYRQYSEFAPIIEAIDLVA